MCLYRSWFRLAVLLISTKDCVALIRHHHSHMALVLFTASLYARVNVCDTFVMRQFSRYHAGLENCLVPYLAIQATLFFSVCFGSYNGSSVFNSKNRISIKIYFFLLWNIQVIFGLRQHWTTATQRTSFRPMNSYNDVRTKHILKILDLQKQRHSEFWLINQKFDFTWTALGLNFGSGLK